MYLVMKAASVVALLASASSLIPNPNQTVYVAPLPEPGPVVVEVLTAEVTAYTASPDETDDTPEITASGARVADGQVACPGRYPFGTRFEIAGRVYVCEDRMNLRYRDGNHFDVFVGSKAAAYEFGRKTLTVKVLGED